MSRELCIVLHLYIGYTDTVSGHESLSLIHILSFKHPAVLAVSGSAGSGKTALLAALLPVLKSRGLKVGVIRAVSYTHL